MSPRRGAVDFERHVGELALHELDDAIGLPNCTRVQAWPSADSKQARAAPADPKARFVQAGQRSSKSRRPRKDGGIGQLTSSSTSSDVTDARSESLRSISGA